MSFSTLVESPLRRSGIHSSPSSTTFNDDEKERVSARESAANSPANNSNSITSNETLKTCLYMFSENKLSKENAWNYNVIDALSNLIKSHHKQMSNFQMVGRTLEASSRVYGLRVDSVHMDVMRMSSGLNKKNFNEMMDHTSDYEDQTENSEEQNGDNTGKKNDNGSENASAKKVRKQRRQISTITKNKDTINQKLETNPFTDAFFAKMNKYVGDVGSAHRLFQNVVPSKNFIFQLRMTEKFWSDLAVDIIEDDEDIDISQAKYPTAEININEMQKDLILRPKCSGYIITDTPVEDDNQMNDLSFSEKLNGSQLDVAFDINAEVEPINSDTNNYMNIELDGSDMDVFTEEDHQAINACRGLRQTQITIDDMRPVDLYSSKLEYSYRPLDRISQFWAGPSHWKFKKQRQSNAQQLKTYNVTNLTGKNASLRKKQLKKKTVVVFDDEDDEDIENDFISIYNTTLKLKKCITNRNWDAKKLKLPLDLKLPRNLLTELTLCPSYILRDVDENSSPIMNLTSYDYNNVSDQNYCTNIPADDDDTDTDRSGGENFLQPHTMNSNNLENHDASKISEEFAGAPEKIEKIVVPYAKTAKIIDMKQLKKCCWHLISTCPQQNSQEELTQEQTQSMLKIQTIRFNDLYKHLPKLLSKTMSENLSPAIAFYSVLHLANENGLRMKQQESLNDFDIINIVE